MATCVVTTLSLTGCKSSNEKVEDAQEKVVDAKENEMEAEKELTDKKMDSVTNYTKMKAETQRLVEQNEVKIAEFKMKLKVEKAENQKKFETKIDKLEGKNNKLKADLNDYTENGKESWNTFKMCVKNSVDDMNKDIDNYKKEHNY